MKRNFRFTALLAGSLLAITPLLAAGTQAGSGNLLAQMKLDAQTIQSHADKLAQLTEDTNTRWAQFDRQWNEIKPAQEELQMKLDRLEAIQATLTDQQRKELDQCKAAVQGVGASTHRLYRLIDQPGTDLTSRQFRTQARALAKDAADVAHAS